MDWIQRYRESVGMSRTQFAKAITYQMGGSGNVALTVSGALIGILEDMNGAVTHPRLANLIARACGATPRQRDRIVEKKHRGTWPGVDGPQLVVGGLVASRAETTENMGGNTRRVVVLDRLGIEIRRFGSISQAADFIGISRSGVSQRCRHIIPYEWSTGCLYTARYADEWDAMSANERIAEMRRDKGRGNGPNYRARTNTKKQVVMVDRTCRELGRFTSIAEAEKSTHVSDTTISNRCAHVLKREWTPQFPFTFRYAEEWDAMTPEQRREDVGAG